MTDKITCPNCNHQFDVEEAISGQLEARIREKYQQKIEQQAEVFRKQKDELSRREEEFEKARERANEEFKERLNRKIQEEKVKLKQEAKENANAELLALKEENEKRKEELREAKSKEIELLKKENALKEKAEELELDLQKKMLEQTALIEEKARQKEREANELREKEYQKQLEDQKKLIEEMKRKAEQGSMQLQGEVQELAIEEYLRNQFPFDSIEEIKKGQMGADCVQIVNTRDLRSCGIIQYESKRTKSFSEAWIDKLKKDMQSRSAHIGVIVTEAMPNDMNRMGLRNGIWVCSFEEFKGLCKVLRQSVIEVKKSSITQENKGDKMSFLYDYLTGNEFRMQVESIVDGFTAMKNQLDTEKRAFTRQWKEREKQIDRVMNNTIEMYGAIKGIGGKSIPTINTLELDQDDNQQELGL